MEKAIKFNGVTKEYSRQNRSLRSSISSLFGKKDDLASSQSFCALKGISFEVEKGKTLGIIGPNGAGKSTILKLLAGITKPSSGSIEIKGKMGVLLELGAGFHPEFSGRENIYLNGSIMGMKRDDIDRNISSIIEFSELESFIDMPVKYYSSGMYVRLGFATAIHCNPDILLIDEVLAVGDAKFFQKCLRKFEEFQNRNMTIIFVSHDMNAIKRNCHEVILLQNGEIIDRGNPTEIIDLYNAIIFRQIEAETSKSDFSPSELAKARENGKSQKYGTQEAKITDVSLLNGKGDKTNAITSMEDTKIIVKVRFLKDLKDILAGITVRNNTGIDVYMTNTRWKGIDIPEVKKESILEICFSQKMTLVAGKYTVTVAVSQSTENGIKRLDWISDYLIFEVVSEETVSGITNLDSSVSVNIEKP